MNAVVNAGDIAHALDPILGYSHRPDQNVCNAKPTHSSIVYLDHDESIGMVTTTLRMDIMGAVTTTTTTSDHSLSFESLKRSDLFFICATILLYYIESPLRAAHLV